MKYDKHKALAWYGMAWKGQLQQGMIAPSEESLEELVEDYFTSAARDMKDNDDWEIVPLTIIVPDIEAIKI